MPYDTTIDKEICIDEPILICEIVERHEHAETNICYDAKNNVFTQCPKCKKFGILNCSCKCRHITYCS